MSLPGKSMKIGGWNYHVSDQGEGDKVAFLVHGMPDDGSCWKYQAPALLKAGYRVIVPDTLGYEEATFIELLTRRDIAGDDHPHCTSRRTRRRASSSTSSTEREIAVTTLDQATAPFFGQDEAVVL